MPAVLSWENAGAVIETIVATGIRIQRFVARSAVTRRLECAAARRTTSARRRWARA